MKVQLDRQTPVELASGSLTAVEAVTRTLERIAASEVDAFVCVRADEALTDAEAIDREGRRPWQNGELRGLPFAVKDTIDTHDLPTEYNSPIYSGYQPAKDAACVELLRQAGAILVGKTTTVEFASLGAVPATRNPYDSQRSPGGSSAGSGAAVGGGLVPLALGTQTGGSTIRPASFCGAVGFKPTFARVSFEGAKPYAPSLDTLGWMTSTVELAARVGAVLGAGFEPLATTERPEGRLRLGVYRTRYWKDAEPESRTALDTLTELARQAGHEIDVVADPCADVDLNALQDVVMHGEGRQAFVRRVAAESVAPPSCLSRRGRQCPRHLAWAAPRGLRRHRARACRLRSSDALLRRLADSSNSRRGGTCRRRQRTRDLQPSVHRTGRSLCLATVLRARGRCAGRSSAGERALQGRGAAERRPTTRGAASELTHPSTTLPQRLAQISSNGRTGMASTLSRLSKSKRVS